MLPWSASAFSNIGLPTHDMDCLSIFMSPLILFSKCLYFSEYRSFASLVMFFQKNFFPFCVVSLML